MVDNIDNELIKSSSPQSLTLSNKALATLPSTSLFTDTNSHLVSSLMDEDLPDDTGRQTPGSLSRSSTASLGVLSNLNDVLAAADDGSDFDDDFDYGIAGNRLAPIDESLSPLPSL